MTERGSEGPTPSPEESDQRFSELGALAVIESLSQQVEYIENVEQSIHSLLPQLSHLKSRLRKQIHELEAQAEEQD
jgi:hypothetical protein